MAEIQYLAVVNMVCYGLMRQVICLLIQSQSVSAFKILAQIKAAYCHDSERLLTRWVELEFGSEY